MSEQEILYDISKKLDRIIALAQIGLSTQPVSLRTEIKKEKVSMKILEYADGVLSASELQKKVSDEADVSERTVKKRLSELVDKGLILSVRDGTSIFYINSGIVEV